PGGCRPDRDARARSAELHTRARATPGRAGSGSRSQLLLAGRAPLLHAQARSRAALPPPPALQTRDARVLPAPRPGLCHLRAGRRLGAESQPGLDPGARVSRGPRAAGLPGARPSCAALTPWLRGVMLAPGNAGGAARKPAAEKAGGTCRPLEPD